MTHPTANWLDADARPLHAARAHGSHRRPELTVPLASPRDSGCAARAMPPACRPDRPVLYRCSQIVLHAFAQLVQRITQAALHRLSAGASDFGNLLQAQAAFL